MDYKEELAALLAHYDKLQKTEDIDNYIKILEDAYVKLRPHIGGDDLPETLGGMYIKCLMFYKGDNDGN